jgi:hypothetical protein
MLTYKLEDFIIKIMTFRDVESCTQSNIASPYIELEPNIEDDHLTELEEWSYVELKGAALNRQPEGTLFFEELS